MKKNKLGFTLIELLVVVLIVGVLAAIALPQYSRTVRKARMTEGLQNMHTLIQAKETCALSRRGISRCTNAADIDIAIPEGSNDWSYQFDGACGADNQYHVCANGTEGRLPSLRAKREMSNGAPVWTKECVHGNSAEIQNLCDTIAASAGYTSVAN